MSDVYNTAINRAPFWVVNYSAGQAATKITVPVIGDQTGWVNVQAVGGDVYVLFGDANLTIGATGGWVIFEGQTASYYVTEGQPYLATGSSSTGVLRVSNG